MIHQTEVFYSRKNILFAVVISLVYLLISNLLIGFKTDQLVLTCFFNSCFFASIITRKFIIAFSIFIVYWILFDYMKAFPNYQYNVVHIQDLYNADKSLFGIPHNNKIISPNEFWLQNSNTFLGVLSGIFYLCWIPVPLALSLYFFFKRKSIFLHFALTFLLINLIGFIIYYAYPAAPPWYYQLNGPSFLPATPGNTAGLNTFDEYFKVYIFSNMYEKISNVFAAMPSLHCSYPMVVFYYGIKEKLGWVNVFFLVVMLGIWFAAIYTSHHYTLDVFAGIVCALLGIFIFQKILLKNTAFIKFLDRYKGEI